MAIAQWLPLGGEARLVMIDDGGRVIVATGMVDQGAGTHTAMRRWSPKSWRFRSSR